MTATTSETEYEIYNVQQWIEVILRASVLLAMIK